MINTHSGRIIGTMWFTVVVDWGIYKPVKCFEPRGATTVHPLTKICRCNQFFKDLAASKILVLDIKHLFFFSCVRTRILLIANILCTSFDAAAMLMTIVSVKNNHKCHYGWIWIKLDNIRYDMIILYKYNMKKIIKTKNTIKYKKIILT